MITCHRFESWCGTRWKKTWHSQGLSSFPVRSSLTPRQPLKRSCTRHTGWVSVLLSWLRFTRVEFLSYSVISASVPPSCKCQLKGSKLVFYAQSTASSKLEADYPGNVSIVDSSDDQGRNGWRNAHVRRPSFWLKRSVLHVAMITGNNPLTE